MKGNLLKNVLSALSDTEIKTLPSSSSLAELKPEQMRTILQQLFGDSIHVIDPDLSLQASPLARAPAQAVGSVQYLRALRPLTPLKKPVVMLVSQPQSWTSFSSGGSFPGTRVTHGWHAIVIVPQNYQTPEGKSVGNDQNPRLYYFDPQKQLGPTQVPAEIMGFCQVLTRGCQVPEMRQGRAVQVREEPVFRQLRFSHGCRDICAKTQNSSGWGALYFAIMAISYGGVSFPETDRLSLSKFQAVLLSVLLEPTQVIETSPTSSSSSSSSSSFSSLSAESMVTETSLMSTEESLLSSSSSSCSSSSSSTLTSTEVASELKSLPERLLQPTSDTWLQEALKTITISADSGAGLSEMQETSALTFQWEILRETASNKKEDSVRVDRILPKTQPSQSYHAYDFELVSRHLNLLNGDFFVQNTLKHWHSRQGQMQQREVLYLFSGEESPQKIGLVIRWLNPSLDLAQTLWKAHGLTDQQPQKTKAQRYLKNKTLMADIQNLYTGIEVLVFRGMMSVAPSVDEQIRVQLPQTCHFQTMGVRALYALPLSESKKESIKKTFPHRQKRDGEKFSIPPSTESPSSVPVTSEEKKSADGVGPAQSIPTYTPAIMAGILRAYRIATTLDTKPTRDSSDRFELMAYPQAVFSEPVFLQALLQNWQARKGQIDNQRAAFLFSGLSTQTGQAQSVVILIQYAVANTILASRLWREQLTAQTASASGLLDCQPLVQAASRLYEQVQVTVLGVAAQFHWVNSLKAPLAKVCRGQVALNFKAIPQTAAYSVVLIEDMLGMLQHGQIREVEVSMVAEAHRERCVQAILNRWQETEHHQALLHEELLATLRRVSILNSLRAQRELGYRRAGEEILSPRVRKTRDEAMKRYLYAQSFPDPRALIEGLLLTILTSFLITTEVNENLKALNQHRDQLQLERLQWELTLQDELHREHRTPCDYLTQAGQFIYYSTWIGMGGMLFRTLGDAVSGESTASAQQRELAQQQAGQPARLIGQVVKRLTRSETLATQSATTVRLYLGTEPVSRGLGLLGTFLGVVVQIYSGPYAFIQMLSMSAITLTAYRKVESDRLDDLKAELKEPAFSLTALHRASMVLWHGGEALVQGSFVPLILAVGSVAGSTVSMTVTRRKSSPELKSHQRDGTEERKALMELLIRQIGALLGQQGAAKIWELALSIHHRILYRDTAMALLIPAASQQSNIREWNVEGADFRDPRFWINQHNPLKLSWITSSGEQRRAICEIKGLPILTPAGITGLDCQGDMPTTELSTILSLPRP